MKKLLLSSIIAFNANYALAQNITYENVIGKTFISSAGSSSGTFLMSVSIKVTGRNTVSVGFVGNGIDWSGPDISAVDKKIEPTQITEVILNCKLKKYSPEPKFTDNYSFKEFKDGTKYKWGDYSGQELLVSMGVEAEKSLTSFFSTVCRYSAQ